MEQNAVLCIVGDQIEEQDHLPTAAFDRSSENNEDVYREETTSAEDSGSHEDKESEESTDSNGGNGQSIEKSREIIAGHEEAQ